MDENEKNLNEQEAPETEAVEAIEAEAAEDVEEAVAEAAEAAEEVEAEAAEAAEAVEEEAAGAVEETADADDSVIVEDGENPQYAPDAVISAEPEAAAPAQSKNNKPVIIAVVIVIVAALIALIGYNAYQSAKYKALLNEDGYLMMDGRSLQDLADYMGMSKEKYIEKYGNPYNQQGYIDTSGRTIEQVAADLGMESVEEFLSTYGLPEDMPYDTTESSAFYSMTMDSYASMYGMTYDQIKEFISFPDEVTGETTLGTAEGMLTLNEYAGEDYVDEFKAEYDLGDDVTGETLYKDVRRQVETKLKEQREAEEAAEAAEADEAADDTDTDESADTDEADTESDTSDEEESAEVPAESAAE